MLFNSYPFLFKFLPFALLGYQVAGMFHRKAVVAWLGFVSLVFYGYWRPAFLIVLVCSIALNYTAAGLISGAIPNRVRSNIWMWAAIGLNLGALGYFKYFFPALNFVSGVTGSSRHWIDIAIPLGISFFTFTQIAYLVDLQQGVATQQDLMSYVLFVTFFPHLIAGPILHHKEMMPQFQEDRRYQLRGSDVAVGLSWFIMGLGKKVILADTYSKMADAVFRVAGPVSVGDAWSGSLCYALQLYFDFSGYSDMALGLARMFSIDFPLNFDSPYKSTSIIDFWQRWHMTLSQYINAYVYSPLAFWVRERRRNAGRSVKRAVLTTPEGFASMIAFPTLLSLLIAGVWHGAGFQFLMYGLLHGVYLTVNHAWRVFFPVRQANKENEEGRRLVRAARHGSSVVLTFVCVLVTFVFFRAESSGRAVSLLGSMVGAHHGMAKGMVDQTLVSGHMPLKIACGFLIVWFLPNTQQILSRFKPSLQADLVKEESGSVSLRWVPSVAWALALGCVLFFSVVQLEDPSTFLYFQF